MFGGIFMHKVVAIDGYSASGKGTVADLLAKKLGYLRVDSGVFYRAITDFVLTYHIDINDPGEIFMMANHISYSYDKNGIYINGKNVMDRLRTKEVDQNVIKICEIKSVRNLVNEKIRALRETSDIIIDGRDTTTEVFPDAEVKVYLTASFETRAKRRYNQYLEKGIKLTYAEVIENLKYRDHSDDTRETGALRIADDAIVIDSSSMSAEEVCDIIIKKLESVRSNENEFKRSIH